MNEAQTRLDKIASHGARHAVTLSPSITRCQARCDKARCDISKSMAMKSRIISSYISP